MDSGQAVFSPSISMACCILHFCWLMHHAEFLSEIRFQLISKFFQVLGAEREWFGRLSYIHGSRACRARLDSYRDRSDGLWFSRGPVRTLLRELTLSTTPAHVPRGAVLGDGQLSSLRADLTRPQASVWGRLY
jgi:hypothetical protein